MKAKTISVEIDEFKIKGPAERMVQLFALGMLAQTLPPAANVQPLTSTTAPAFGEYWPGEGGINGGYVPAHGQVPEHYLIFATKDAGRHAWGRHGETSKATDKRDGLANTAILLAEGDHPAAKAAAEYTADGHADFYLGAAAEMYQGWLNCPDKFDQDAYYYTSTQFSADYAYSVGFSGGGQDFGYKYGARSVRPVRRRFI
ncbi:DUF1566 domain-containing protein [Pseudomonas sp. WS 5059]|uniref:DUF1566 domain-containing protein n=1 Tax=Pseudomonas sp. WS 5059 TaxID=2717491 RepID=UPI0014734129|nr:DUF1566 domain-containing protein [Pseudomonas sp. WS 5059]NMY04594.1 DUF1566 domain-containing protein [Pseudomonas sp. WS 5059]